MRLYPWWQQAVAMGGIFALERMTSFLVVGATTGGAPPWQFWLAPAVGMLLWPLIFILLRASFDNG